MSDTPESDGAAFTPRDCIFPDELDGSVVTIEFARNLERQRDELQRAIHAFCEGARWACSEWKNQDHIKPLFDIAAKIHPSA